MITYAHEKFIEEAINGVLMQECNFKIELIVANDCSPDTTNKIVKHIIETHPRGHWIKYVNHKENIGMMPNFIWALQQCTGSYIALCEGDDYWTDPLKLQKQVDFLEGNKNCCLSHHSQLKLNGKNLTEDLRFKGLNDGDINEASDLFSFKIQPQTRTILFRNCLTAEDLKSDFLKQAIFGDFAICFLLAKYGQFGYLNENMAIYRIHELGLASRSLQKKEDYFISRLKLVEMWCKAFGFLNCNKSSFKKGIMKLYTSGINKMGRKRSLRNVLKHWINMNIDTRLFLEIYFKLLLKPKRRT